MITRVLLLATVTLLASLPGDARPQPAAVVPRFEAVAETRLLMEGLAHANYRGLQRLLKTKPADDETWVLARGQALLVAETGNLLLLRPPRNAGRDTWMRLGMELRDGAAGLAQDRRARSPRQPGRPERTDDALQPLSPDVPRAGARRPGGGAGRARHLSRLTDLVGTRLTRCRRRRSKCLQPAMSRAGRPLGKIAGPAANDLTTAPSGGAAGSVASRV